MKILFLTPVNSFLSLDDDDDNNDKNNNDEYENDQYLNNTNIIINGINHLISTNIVNILQYPLFDIFFFAS